MVFAVNATDWTILFKNIIYREDSKRHFFHLIGVHEAVANRAVDAPTGVDSGVIVEVTEDAVVDLGEVFEEGVNETSLGDGAATGGGWSAGCIFFLELEASGSDVTIQKAADDRLRLASFAREHMGYFEELVGGRDVVDNAFLGCTLQDGTEDVVGPTFDCGRIAFFIG